MGFMVREICLLTIFFLFLLFTMSCADDGLINKGENIDRLPLGLLETPNPKGLPVGSSDDMLAPDFRLRTPDGDNLTLSSFRGKPVVLNFWATWCSPCNDLAGWLTHNDQKITKNPWWKDQYLPIRDMIESGEIFLVNFMFEGKDKANKVTATPDDVASWYKKYPDPHVPVLADEYRFLHTWVKPTGLPCIFLVDENMRLINYTSRGLTEAFLYLTKPEK